MRFTRADRRPLRPSLHFGSTVRIGRATSTSSYMTIQRWITVLAAVVALPVSGFTARAGAQGITTGAIGGLVTDSTGAPLGDVQIQVRNAGSGFVVGATTR